MKDKLTRKQLRKQHRKDKKVKKNEWYSKKKAQKQSGKPVVNNKNEEVKPLKKVKVAQSEPREPQKKMKKVPTIEEERRKEKQEQLKLQQEMDKQRNILLKEANEDEDRTIRQLEKQLKLNKRGKKVKAIPKSFSLDGLDYILEVCDSETMGNAIEADQRLHEANNKFDEDLALMAGSKGNNDEEDDDEEDDNEEDDEEEEIDLDDEEEDEFDLEDDEEDVSEEENDEFAEEEEDDEMSDEEKGDSDDEEVANKDTDSDNEDSDNFYEEPESGDSDNSDTQRVSNEKKRKNTENSSFGTKAKKTKVMDDEGSIDESEKGESDNDESWEDIYGRKRKKDGSIESSGNKYIPPAIRAQMEVPQDKKRIEKLNKLSKLVKGLMNRLAESNMHSIATQLEELYMNNSRSDMNTLLTKLILEALVSNVITPERLLMEHVMLIAILHANVGTEVGANFLQTVAKKFDELYEKNIDVENKTLDNTVNILAQLYNFKLIDAKLIYEIIEKFSSKFEEKDVECILHILRSVGFNLRKDDPLALKTLILDLQKRASAEKIKENSRIKFMLDILLAIKNNNVTKIPNYDTSYSEHLKKIMKGFVRKGNYVSQLNITLEDLLKVEERGRWWIVGSAWTGKTMDNVEKKDKEVTNSFSQKLLDLARKQRMNTDIRRTIFCTILSAEDYLDAFEKLLKLGLKNQQERDIIHVILHCSLQEKKYNPYYSVLAQKFCEYDRKYQLTIKYSIWDKLKALKDQSKSQIANLAKLLSHLFLEKALPITTLKVVEFRELDKVTSSFIRLTLFGILLHEDTEACTGVFDKLAFSEKLKVFRERLKLFIHQFILSNLEANALSEDLKKLLKKRAKAVVQLLSVKARKEWD